MKKKKRTLYLLIAVVAIYAAIIFRFLLLRDGGESQINTSPINNTFNPIEYDVQKEFKIVNDYRDPFLGKIKKETGDVSTKKLNIQNNRSKELPFPQVDYLGVVADTGGEKKVLSLRVNSNEYVMREGATVDSLTIISGNQKSMIVSYNGNRKTINIIKQ